MKLLFELVILLLLFGCLGNLRPYEPLQLKTPIEASVSIVFNPREGTCSKPLIFFHENYPEIKKPLQECIEILNDLNELETHCRTSYLPETIHYIIDGNEIALEHSPTVFIYDKIILEDSPTVFIYDDKNSLRLIWEKNNTFLSELSSELNQGIFYNYTPVTFDCNKQTKE